MPQSPADNVFYLLGKMPVYNPDGQAVGHLKWYPDPHVYFDPGNYLYASGTVLTSTDRLNGKRINFLMTTPISNRPVVDSQGVTKYLPSAGTNIATVESKPVIKTPQGSSGQISGLNLNLPLVIGAGAILLLMMRGR